MTVLIDQSADVSEATAERAARPLDAFFSRVMSSSAVAWNWMTLGGLSALVVIWAAWFYGTWETWGWLTADCGREMYVPAVLAEGKTLYKDVWYLYGPLAPYLNSFLFRIFGVHLNVLYWAGSLSALGSALLLYFSGMRMSSTLAGWTAAAVVLTQSFHPSLFSFPLPYSFASAYGCLMACLFLWLMIRGANSNNRAWVLGAGIAAAAAFLLKLEIGMACYGGLALLIATRAIRQKSWRFAVRDLASCLPGLMACILVVLWMISLGGFQFLTQENISSWPTSYFMTTYGKYWLASTGFQLTGEAFVIAAKRTLLLLGIFQGFHLLLSWKSTAGRLILLRLALFAAALVYLRSAVIRYAPVRMFQETLRNLFFPQDMVLYVAIAAIIGWLYFAGKPSRNLSTAPLLCFSFACLLGFRILLMTMPCGYPIFYNAPAVLSMLLLTRQLISASGHSRRFLLAAEAMICFLILTAAAANWNRLVESPSPRTARLTTRRGSVFLSPQMAEEYQAAINFMAQQKLRGEQVLSVPEDTGLYFFSATDCATRVFAFDPGVVAPGKMTEEAIQQIEQKPVRYLIWSNRLFTEYNALRFGIDFNQELGRYLFSHYHRVGPLVQHPVGYMDWSAFIWERNAETKSK
jgi:hypothetical protein